ncbi:MAG: acyltransferase [Chlorobi bacterium]|nr:acyltransferase [Chlorobiota bacterium]
MVEEGDHLVLGQNVFISQHCTISGTVTIGRDSLIAGFVTIVDATHVFDDSTIPVNQQGGRKEPISIGEDVWIGTSSVILQGVNIGNHAVIGANSTVTKDIPPWAIAAGSPAKVLRYRKR